MNLHEPSSISPLIFIRHAGFRAADVVLDFPSGSWADAGFQIKGGLLPQNENEEMYFLPRIQECFREQSVLSQDSSAKYL